MSGNSCSSSIFKGTFDGTNMYLIKSCGSNLPFGVWQMIYTAKIIMKYFIFFIFYFIFFFAFYLRFMDTNYWIGLQYSNEKYDWIWVDGKIVTYDDWQRRPSATDNTYCARVKRERGWKELYCDKVIRFVCERGRRMS